MTLFFGILVILSLLISEVFLTIPLLSVAWSVFTIIAIVRLVIEVVT